MERGLVRGCRNGYLRSPSTPCGSWLACANMLVAEFVRIWFRVNFVLSLAKSVSRMRLSASVVFVIIDPRFATVFSSRFIAAPTSERMDRTDPSVLSMFAMADCAADCVPTDPRPRSAWARLVLRLKLIVEDAPDFAEETWNEKLDEE